MSRGIADKLITDELFEQIIGYVYVGLGKGEYEITQRNIIRILKPKKISNKTIARVINELIPTAKATANSVNSQIRSMNRSNDLNKEITNELLKEFSL